MNALAAWTRKNTDIVGISLVMLALLLLSSLLSNSFPHLLEPDARHAERLGDRENSGDSI